MSCTMQKMQVHYLHKKMPGPHLVVLSGLPTTRIGQESDKIGIHPPVTIESHPRDLNKSDHSTPGLNDIT